VVLLWGMVGVVLPAIAPEGKPVFERSTAFAVVTS